MIKIVIASIVLWALLMVINDADADRKPASHPWLEKPPPD